MPRPQVRAGHPEGLLPAPGDPLPGVQRRALGQAERSLVDRRPARRAARAGRRTTRRSTRRSRRSKRSFADGPKRSARRRRRRSSRSIKAIEGASASEPRADRLGRRRLERAGRDPDPAAGQSRHARPEGRPGRPRLLDRSRQSLRAEAALAGLELDRPSAGPGALADEARLAAGGVAGAGAGQPDLAAPFRHRPGRDVRQPRLYRLAADPSRAARVPGRRARPVGLECQGAAPPDRDLDGLSTVERAASGGRAHRSRQPTAGPLPAPSARRRVDPRRDARRLRRAGRPPGRPVRPDRADRFGRGRRRPNRPPARPGARSISSSAAPRSPACSTSSTPPRSSPPAPAASPRPSPSNRSACSTPTSSWPGPGSWRERLERASAIMRSERPTPGSRGPSCWSSAAARAGRSATRPGGSWRRSPPDTPACPPPTPAAAPGPTSARCYWPATHSSMSSESP